jgi:hypothetical protein
MCRKGESLQILYQCPTQEVEGGGAWSVHNLTFIFFALFRNESFGRKTSWKSKQIARSEKKAMKELERTVKEALQKEREVSTQWKEVVV